MFLALACIVTYATVLHVQLTICMQLFGTRYPCTRSTFANRMLSAEEPWPFKTWFGLRVKLMISFCDKFYCDLKTLCFYLAFSWFSRVYIVMERGRNLTEKFREEIIINKRIKKISDFCIDESRIEQQIVMPYNFLAFFLCLSTAPVVFLCTCSRNFIHKCIRGKDFSYNENRKF